MYHIGIETGELVVMPQDYSLLENYEYNLEAVSSYAYHLKTGEYVQLPPTVSWEDSIFEKDKRALKTLNDNGLLFINHNYPNPLESFSAAAILATVESEAGYGFVGKEKPEAFAMRTPNGYSEFYMEPRLQGNNIIQSFRVDGLTEESDIVAPLGTIKCESGRLWITDSSYLRKGGHWVDPIEFPVETDVHSNAMIYGVFGRDTFTEDFHSLKGLAFLESAV